MEKAQERRGFRPTILPESGEITFQIWLFAPMGVGGAKLKIEVTNFAGTPKNFNKEKIALING